jgi:hypothetical protein
VTLFTLPKNGRDDAETHRGDVAFLLHRAGDGGWSGLAGNPLLGAGQLLMQARFAVICGAAHIPVTELARRMR